MVKIPEIVVEAWKDWQNWPVLTTIDKMGHPNTVYVGQVKMINGSAIIIGDSAFFKTRQNIIAGSPGSLLFITSQVEAYQLKGHFSYETEGELFEDLSNWMDPQFTPMAAAVLHVDEVYCGAEKLA